MTEVKKIYVIRRSLFGNYNPKIGPWSHSALLLETNNGNFKILEYGVGGNPNSVTLRDVTFKNSKFNDEFTSFYEKTPDGFKWSKQQYGDDLTKLNCPITDTYLKSIMTDFKNQGSYNLLFHDCHMSQEYVRNAIGLNVENSYTDFQNYLKGEPNISIGPTYDICNTSNSIDVFPNNDAIDVFPNSDAIDVTPNNDVIDVTPNNDNEFNQNMEKIIDVLHAIEMFDWQKALTSPEGAVIDYVINIILRNHPTLISVYNYLANGKINLNSTIDFLTNFLESIDFDYIIDNEAIDSIIHDFIEYSPEIKVIADLIFDKNAISESVGLLADKLTGTNIATLYEDFKHHTSTSRRIVDSAVFVLDVVGNFYPPAKVVAEIIQVVEIVCDFIKSIQTHTREVEYHGIEFVYTFKWHVKILKGEKSYTANLDNDFLNIHLEANEKGKSQNARDVLELQVDDQLMYHLALPKDWLDKMDMTYDKIIDEVRDNIYIYQVREGIVDIYLNHKLITEDQCKDWLNNIIDENTNENIIVEKGSDIEREIQNNVYEPIKKEHDNHTGDFNDMSVLRNILNFSFQGMDTKDFVNKFEEYRALTGFDKFADHLADTINETNDYIKEYLLMDNDDNHIYDNINLTKEQVDDTKEYFDKVNNDYDNKTGICNDKETYLHSLEIIFTIDNLFGDVFGRLMRVVFVDLSLKMCIDRKNIDEKYITDLAKNDLILPLQIKYMNKFILHNISLFNNLEIWQTGIISSIIPMFLSIGITTNQYLNGLIKVEEYGTRFAVTHLNMSSSIGLSNHLYNVINVKNGITLTYSIKTGKLATVLTASTMKTSIAIKAGIITMTIGASTIKSFGIGLIIFAVGLIIILIENIIKKIIKNKNKIIKKKSIYENRNSYYNYDTYQSIYNGYNSDTLYKNSKKKSIYNGYATHSIYTNCFNTSIYS